MSVPEINGTGVRLRALAESELDEVVRGWPEPASRWGSSKSGAWAIADPATDRLLGAVALDHEDPARGQAEAFFWVRPEDRRKGVASAALTALTGWALGDGHWSRLELVTGWDNPIAQRVAIAAGYQREGVRRAVLTEPPAAAVAGRSAPAAAPSAAQEAGPAAPSAAQEAEPAAQGAGRAAQEAEPVARQDAVIWARVAGDPDGPAPRLLPDFPGGELTDGVVTLRPLGPGDIEFYTTLHTEPDVVETSVPPVPPSAATIRHRCASAEAHWLAGIRADLVIVDAATGTPTGGIGLFYFEPPTQQAMIGYSLMPQWRGRGYTTRAARLISLWVFAETGIARLIAGTNQTNVGSQRVLTKAGFHPEGFMLSRLPGKDGTRQDDIQFVLLPQDVLKDLT